MRREAETAGRRGDLAREPAATDPGRAGQEELAALLRWVDAWDQELARIYDSLPAPDPAEADRMEAGECPESLIHARRTAIECLRVDWLPRIRAILGCAIALRVQDLEREWRAKRRGGQPEREG